MSFAAPPTTQQYYDRFAETYDNDRHRGYHRLIDELELDLVRRYGAGKDVFEAGCGTGLLLREAAGVARSAVGLDLSRGMLAPARERGPARSSRDRSPTSRCRRRRSTSSTA